MYCQLFRLKSNIISFISRCIEYFYLDTTGSIPENLDLKGFLLEAKWRQGVQTPLPETALGPEGRAALGSITDPEDVEIFIPDDWLNGDGENGDGENDDGENGDADDSAGLVQLGLSRRAGCNGSISIGLPLCRG